MSTKSNDKSGALDMITTIHQVAGFDPTTLAIEYTDLNTGEKRMRLPVMAQMAWFRLVFPEGKVSVTATLVKDYYVGHAKVYHNYMDPPECFLAEATASRKYDPEKPTVSPREWAQTAAIGVALRNAGFGLQFHAAGDAFDQLAVDELGELINTPDTVKPEPASPTQPVSNNKDNEDLAEPSPQTETVQDTEEAPPEDAFQNALKMPCPIQKYSGKTLGDLLMAGETNVLIWVAEKYKKDPEIAAGARLICEKSLEFSA